MYKLIVIAAEDIRVYEFNSLSVAEKVRELVIKWNLKAELLRIDWKKRMLANLRSANIHRQNEWDVDNRIDLSYRGNELAGEVGEACNLIKKLERERLGIRGSRASKEELAEELADIIICVDLIAMQVNIDLGLAVMHKFNKTSTKYNLKTLLGGPTGIIRDK